MLDNCLEVLFFCSMLVFCLFCIEIKKWNNINDERVEKDKNNLCRLTSDYGYSFGYHLIIGENKENTTIEIFHEGSSVCRPFSLFD